MRVHPADLGAVITRLRHKSEMRTVNIRPDGRRSHSWNLRPRSAADRFVDAYGDRYECNLCDWSQTPPNPPREIGPFDLDVADLNITWRVYMEPATNVGPDENELLYDRAIYFGPYFTAP